MATSRSLCCWALLFLCNALLFAETPEPIICNPNRAPAGKLENGVLTLHLEIRQGAWHPEADDGSQLFVQAFGEQGRPAQIPGPLVRVPEGTLVHASVVNKLARKATVYGLNTRPGDPKAGLELAPGESREVSFAAGTPGTYFYWARTTEIFKTASGRIIERPLFADAQLNGAFIVDAARPQRADRVLIINSMVVPADVTHEKFEVLTINGKSYPYTEPLEYQQGETIRWRVINPGPMEHPMHLHGAFYSLLSAGDFESETSFAEAERQSVVTDNIFPGRTLMMEWTPAHSGRWLYHCHLQLHIAPEKRVPMLTRASETDPAAHTVSRSDPMEAMNDMAGLVLEVNVKSSPKPILLEAAAHPPHKIELLIEPTNDAGKAPMFACSVREGKNLVVSDGKSVGPAIVVTRGEPTEINVVNHLAVPTTIHWHGMELEAYYDGVIGGGEDKQITPAVKAGGMFTARFTPSRAGTFIYHTHAADPNQLSGGMYGPLIVLEPGDSYDSERDKLLIIGSRDTTFEASRITLNGMETPPAIALQHGVKYRLRLINIAPNLLADVKLGDESNPVLWRALAKDGANLPPRLATSGPANLHIVSGEAYDFEYEPEQPGEFPLDVINVLNKAKVMSKVIVR